MRLAILLLCFASALHAGLCSNAGLHAPLDATVKVDWSQLLISTNSEPTLQLVVNPMIRPGSPIHDAVFKNLASLEADMVRFVPWLPYPRLAVAELNPPDVPVRCASVFGTPSTSDASTIFLSCPAPGAVINNIQFAAYGTVTGRCGSFQAGACNAAGAASYVRTTCLNQASCTLNADTPHLGDPCLGTPKILSVQYSCSITTNSTSWDFTLLDPMMGDFFNAMQGRRTVINFSTPPEWLFATPAPVPYPTDPNQVVWNYEQGTQLLDLSLVDLASYYQRLVQYYAAGGFTDEAGLYHPGYIGYLPWWEILNEVDAEHSTSVQDYTARFDAIALAIHAVSPYTQFVGLALSGHNEFDYYRYFLNHSNHVPAAQSLINAISFHFYASPGQPSNESSWGPDFFHQADNFFTEVQQIIAIRNQLSPSTLLMINELGCITNQVPTYNDSYWNLCAALYAYCYGNLAALGVDVIGESQLVGYPSQYPDVTMLDWNTGNGNARYWALKLLISSYGTATKHAYSTVSSSPDIFAQAMIVDTYPPPKSNISKPMGPAPTGNVQQPQQLVKMLLVNKSNSTSTVTAPDCVNGGDVQYVDGTNNYGPLKIIALAPGSVSFTLQPFAVAVLEFYLGPSDRARELQVLSS